eukprot:CAMPEP_0172163130 /NCGR_PEP_ID=MMETSP1050-20130122/7098_1 /TAXON_ID=233186 /ORGANISM="Cryptomonas curvata, Strain CCAP979/52" /LENGTH=102 /DNA_ID=CAMNT_0012833281 /DNA_START=697 /DNA_END=1005 /DNA_ORIENTATION=-
MEIWDGMVNVAEEVKCDVVKAASDAEIITTEAKLICVAKLILERIFASNESSDENQRLSETMESDQSGAVPLDSFPQNNNQSEEPGHPGEMSFSYFGGTTMV